MRKIKYRAWNKENKKMYVVCEISFYDGYIRVEINDDFHCVLKLDRFELLQFTGLHDKKGEEIYEGDIVEYEDYGTGERCYSAVEYDEYRACFYIILFGNEYNQLTDDVCCLVKVVGNIYENPDL